MKQNCWEFKKCGREQGGIKSAEFGVCPAALSTKVNNVHNGKMEDGVVGQFQAPCVEDQFREHLHIKWAIV